MISRGANIRFNAMKSSLITRCLISRLTGSVKYRQTYQISQISWETAYFGGWLDFSFPWRFIPRNETQILDVRSVDF